jgi:hypothetical protein
MDIPVLLSCKIFNGILFQKEKKINPRCFFSPVEYSFHKGFSVLISQDSSHSPLQVPLHFVQTVGRSPFGSRDLLFISHQLPQNYLKHCCIHAQFWLISWFLPMPLVSRVTGYRMDGPGSIPGNARFFCSPQRPDWLWGPGNLLFMGIGSFFPGGKAARTWSWPLTFI